MFHRRGRVVHTTAKGDDGRRVCRRSRNPRRGDGETFAYPRANVTPDGLREFAAQIQTVINVDWQLAVDVDNQRSVKTCLLCDQRADSNEHYIPRWLGEACQARFINVVRGKSKEEVITESQPIGQIKDAQSKILCRACNSALGENLEAPVKAMLSEYVAPDSRIGSLEIDGEILVKWLMLRALEASVVLRQSLLSLSKANEFVGMCQSARDGVRERIWPWFTPSLEAVVVRKKTLGCAVSDSFISTERGPVKSNASGFWFFLQMNSLGLFLIYAPSAQRSHAFGYGVKLFPPGVGTVDSRGMRTNEIPVYQDIRQAYLRLTRLNTEILNQD